MENSSLSFLALLGIVAYAMRVVCIVSLFLFDVGLVFNSCFVLCCCETNIYHQGNESTRQPVSIYPRFFLLSQKGS
jgi:hypothetical protein